MGISFHVTSTIISCDTKPGRDQSSCDLHVFRSCYFCYFFAVPFWYFSGTPFWGFVNAFILRADSRSIVFFLFSLRLPSLVGYSLTSVRRRKIVLRLAGSRLVYRYLFWERERVPSQPSYFCLWLLVMLGSLLDGPWPSLLALLEREPRPALAVQLWPSLLCRVRFFLLFDLWPVAYFSLGAMRLHVPFFFFFLFIFWLFDLKRCVKNAGWCCIPFIEWKPGAAALSSMIENDGAISNGRRYTAACLSVGYSSRTLCDRHMSVQCLDTGQSGGKTHVHVVM